MPPALEAVSTTKWTVYSQHAPEIWGVILGKLPTLKVLNGCRSCTRNPLENRSQDLLSSSSHTCPIMSKPG